MLPDDDLLMHAYVDGELELQQQLVFEQRLRSDAALRESVEEIREITSDIREQAHYHTAPTHLKAMVTRSSRNTSPSPDRPKVSSLIGELVGTLTRGLAWRPLMPALGVAAVALVAANVGLLRIGEEDRLKDELISSHVRATLTDRAVDVFSSDHHTVKPYLSSKLDFSPPVRELGVPGSIFVGGRVDYLDGRRVAVLVYKQGNHLVDHYVWPVKGGDRTPKVETVKGFRVAEWTQSGMAHRLVSDVDEAALEAIVNDLQRNGGSS